MFLKTSRSLRKSGAIVLTLALALSTLGISAPPSEAAKKVKLAKSKLTVKVKQTKKVKIKNIKKKQVKKLTVKSKKTAIATAKKAGKVAVKVTGKKKGTTKVIANLNLKKKVGGKKKYKLTMKVTVKKAAPEPTEEPTPEPTESPTVVTGAAIEVQMDAPVLTDQRYIPRADGGYAEQVTVDGKSVTKEDAVKTDGTLTLDDQLAWDAEVNVLPEDAENYGTVEYTWYGTKTKVEEIKEATLPADAWEVTEKDGDVNVSRFRALPPKDGPIYYYCKIHFKTDKPYPQQPYAEKIIYTNCAEVKVEKLKVTYKGEGATFKETDAGTTEKSEKVVEYCYGDPIGFPPTTADMNYNSSWTFRGWSDKASSSIVTIDSKTPVKSDLTYYACWDAPAPVPTVTLTFNIHNGDVTIIPTDVHIRWWDDTVGNKNRSVTLGSTVTITDTERLFKDPISTGEIRTDDYNIIWNVDGGAQTGSYGQRVDGRLVKLDDDGVAIEPAVYLTATENMTLYLSRVSQ